MLRRIGFLAIASLIVAAGCSGGSTPETKNETPGAEAPKGEERPNPETPSAAAEGSTSEVKFADVHAIIQSNCFPCHEGSGARAGLDMSSYEGLMKGGEKGPVINAGDPAGSLIIKALKGNGAKQMPMMRDPLPADQIAKFEAWIKSGAKNG